MWRSKILLGLIIYFAGFATAIYTLAPASEKTEKTQVPWSLFGSKEDAESESKEFASAFNSGMQKFLCFAEGNAAKVGQAVRARLAEREKRGDK